MEQKTERLNKFLALQLGISRRQADELIEKGRISINGKTAQLGERFKEGDEIKLGEKIISKTREEKKYVIFNKPRGYVCSRKKQGENETIYAILPKEFSVLKPVGRLDKDSSGILLLTNDGDFAFQMTHPKFRKTSASTSSANSTYSISRTCRSTEFSSIRKRTANIFFYRPANSVGTSICTA